MNELGAGPLRALPSEYKGCVFRSRTEARTAYYLDLLAIEWEYEPEGYALPCGNYAPDFFCTAIDRDRRKHQFFVEVKPNYDQFKAYETRLRQLCQASQTDVYYFGGFHEEKTSRFCKVLTNPATGFTYRENLTEDEAPDRGTAPHTENTTSFSAFFTNYAFVVKEWGEPYCGDEYHLFDGEDVKYINRAKFLKFDTAGRAMLRHKQHKNYGIYAG